MPKEIERKWILKELPAWVRDYPHNELTQGSICFDPVIRPRKDGEEYYLTVKGHGKLSREEVNLPISEDTFHDLISKCEGIILKKTRYEIPLIKSDNGDAAGKFQVMPADRPENFINAIYTVELDEFHEDYEGLFYAEVEFPSEEEAIDFKAPDWFGTEVTYLNGYSNACLASGNTPIKATND